MSCTINTQNILHRGSKTGLVPCTLEPLGCSRPDGKKPDGMSLIPWARGRFELWDFTCKDTFASLYVNHSSKKAGYMAKEGQRIKFKHNSHLADQFIFIPVATETSGVIGKLGLDLIKKIGSKITDATNEQSATSYLIQRISIAIQKGNVASILEPMSVDLKEVFYL